MKHRKQQTVCVAYPYATQQSSRFAHCLLELFNRDMQTTQRIQSRAFNSSGANITNARNEIVEGFLKSDVDYLWFIDTDMVFEPDVLERLIAAAHPEKRPIIGALCFSWQQGAFARPTLYMARSDGKIGSFWEYPKDKLVEVDATGTGCLLIHRSVLEKMGEQYTKPYQWFMESALGDLPVGEDVSFCIRARSLGFPIYVDTSIKVGHEKTFVVDEGVYRAQRASKQLEPPKEPTYVVIASKDRPRELTALYATAVGEASHVFVLDNGYEDPPFGVGFTPAHGWPLHRMWNHGLELAEAHAEANDHTAWNVAILNDDIRIGPDTLTQLARGLRADDRIWISYPDFRGVVADGDVAQLENPQMAQQTMSGWCFMLRGETGLRFDEQFEWWYGDSALEKDVRDQGKFVVAVGGCNVEHLSPMTSTFANPERLSQAIEDEKKFAAKYGLDPDSLWLAQNAEKIPALVEKAQRGNG